MCLGEACTSTSKFSINILNHSSVSSYMGRARRVFLATRLHRETRAHFSQVHTYCCWLVELYFFCSCLPSFPFLGCFSTLSSFNFDLFTQSNLSLLILTTPLTSLFPITTIVELYFKHARPQRDQGTFGSGTLLQGTAEPLLAFGGGC